MRKFFTIALMLGLVACGGGGSSGGANGGGPPAANVFVATSVADALNNGIQRGLDGIWVYIDDGSSPAVFQAVGVENRATLAPAQTTSLFKIASVSKMFIAVASVRLVNAGTLKLDDTLAFWLPSLAERIDNADTITVRQLLQHRSGVPDFDSEPGFSWRASHRDLDAVLSLVLDEPADFAPNARYAYSNTNYLLIGRILDTALGYSHHDFVRNEITAPLGMNNTYSLLSDTDASLLAHGYWDDSDRTAQDYVVPGGSMISTAAEVGVFLRALADGTLLNDDEQRTYATLFGDIGHSGWLPGYQSLAYHHRGMDTVVVQLVNLTGGTSEQVAQEVYDSLVDYLRRQ